MRQGAALDAVAVVLGAGALVVLVGHRGAGGAALVIAVLTVPLVLADVRRRLLPNMLTVPILVVGIVQQPEQVPVAAAVALGLGALHLAGGLGMGDVKLGVGLAFPLGAEQTIAGAGLAFLLAGLWALPLVLAGDRSRIAFGPFQLAAFWIVLAAG
ncbi:hypothetical protein GSU68_11740 [Rathayibacter sp. VKM Ac-2759]|uniref:prepilin peptidase n=1 Tax=Rathayibacter sp. VKM Ac-2759 TaxID=2609252 RepID=UPI00131667E1|nr:prepilin peptidase [Rathayibacter sp. VKM Ac-2759]QHC67167.1 hypothetical protein GSU68_11740 [Rathayibacter sp. VKM Ac-2759]